MRLWTSADKGKLYLDVSGCVGFSGVEAKAFDYRLLEDVTLVDITVLFLSETSVGVLPM